MARIEGIPQRKAGLLVRLACWFSKRMVGKVVEPAMIIAHHPWIFRAYGAYEVMLDRARLVDARLTTLAGLKAAALIGCPF
jgi:hypothetical protein